MVVNLVIYAFVFYLGYSFLIANIGKWIGADQSEVSFLIHALNLVLMILGCILILFICYLLFTVFGGLVTAPFNEEISQRVEEIVTGKTNQHKLGFWEDAYASIIGEIQKITFYLGVLFLLFLLDFIPAIGNAAAITLGTLFSFYYNALDFMDYPLTRQRAIFRQKLKVTHKGGMVSYGFGCMAFIMMFLPVLNVFMKPILVAAGTSLFYEREFNKIGIK